MIRLVTILVAVGLFAAALAWLADQEGALQLTLGSYEIRTSVGVAAGLLIVLLGLVILALRLVGALWRTPGIFGRWIDGRRTRAGYQALSRGLVAAAAGDAQEARRFAKKSEALLGAPPLRLLLTAQAAQLDGDEDKQTACYRAMLEHPDTAFLGLRGLFMQAMRYDDEDAALDYAARALTLRPKAGWATNALFDMYARRGAWADAQRALEMQTKRRMIDSGVARRRRAVLLAARALDAERRGDVDAALSCALQALKLSPGLTPAAVIAAHRLAAAGRSWKAQDVIEAAWAQAPHPDLAVAYQDIFKNEDDHAHAERLRGLAQLNPSDFESRLLLAEQALAEKRWVAARAILTPLTENSSTARVCALMAALTQGEHGDERTAKAWLARSVRAPRDAQWTCGHCGWSSGEWTATCGHCGAFDSLAWTAPVLAPVEMLGPEASTASEALEIAPPSVRMPPVLEGPPATGGEAAPWPRPPDDPGILAEEPSEEPCEEPRRPVY